MKKIIFSLLILFILLITYAVIALADVQAGIALQSPADKPISAAVSVEDWLSKKWGVRGVYGPAEQILSGDIIYEPNRGSSVAPYLGAGIRDDMGNSSSGAKLEVIGGVEVNTAKLMPNTSISIEVSGAPSDLGTTSTVTFSLNYRLNNVWTHPRGSVNSSSDQVLLAKLITAEAGEEPYEGQVAVGAVVVNRTHTALFPQTIHNVVYEPGQFHTAGKLRYLQPTETALRAAREALSGRDPSNGALYFYNPATSSPQGLRFFSRLKVTARIGNHVFTK